MVPFSLNKKIDFKISNTENDIKMVCDTVSILSNKIDNLCNLSESVANLNLKFDKLGADNEKQCKSVSEDISNIREVLLNNVVESNKQIQGRVNVLENRIDTLEKNVNINSQRQRENNIEFHGISNEITDANLRGTILAILGKLNIAAYAWDIQGCHRLPERKGSSTKPVIVKIVNRGLPENILEKRAGLKNCDFSDFPALMTSQIYANVNLSPPFKEIDFFCRKLKREGHITSYNVFREGIKIFVDNRYHKIYHMNDLRDLFPDSAFEPLVRNEFSK